jgi:enoyl-CoA hydratase/carnithine racemase
MTPAVEFTPVTAERRGRVAWLVLDGAERRNALSTRTILDLAAALRAADADPDVGAVVLTGRGKAFSAGADLKEFHASLSDDATRHWQNGEPWYDLFSLVPRMSRPVIAAVNGPALAGACGLVAVCDMAIAAESASFATPEVNIGLFPLFILPALVRAVGRRHALSLALTGRTIGAIEAERMGLVNQVVADQDFEATATGVAESLALKMPFTIALGKHVFRRIADTDYDAGLELARAIRGAFLASDDLRRGTEAFFARPRADGR